jgi:hypothetical protein
MYSILDIDLDYFYLAEDPVDGLEKLLRWAGRPVDLVVGLHEPRFPAEHPKTKAIEGCSRV